MLSNRVYPKQAKMKGAALFVSLIMLLLLTMIGIASMNSSMTELQISNNLQEKMLSVQSSQTGIDIAMCLADSDLGVDTTTGLSKNPFKKKYTIDASIKDGSDLASQYSWIAGVDEDPFENNNGSAITSANCSLAAGAINDGSQNTIAAISGETLTVGVKQVASKITCPRAQEGTSHDQFSCNAYVTRSEHEYTVSGANSNTWAGVYRQVLSGK